MGRIKLPEEEKQKRRTIRTKDFLWSKVAEAASISKKNLNVFVREALEKHVRRVLGR
jgi:predicted HicB family RNase H-like nuclease